MSFGNVLLVSGSANFSTRDVWDGYRIALAAEGIRVIPYPTFSHLKVLSVDAVCNDILGTALDLSNRIDCVVFIDGLYFRGERARLPLSLRRAGMPTVLIATDDPYESIQNLEELYTYRFTNEIRCVRPGIDYLPTATLPLPEIPRVQQPRYDLSFLGTVFEDRLPLILKVAEYCEQTGRRFLVAGKILAGTKPFEHLVGTELRQRTIDTVEKLDIYSQSRLTLNLFRKSEQTADSPSPRVFEVTAFGQASLVSGPSRSEVHRIYGDSLYYFDDEASLIQAIEAGLSNESERIRKTERARQITLSGQLYEHRARRLISHLREQDQQVNDAAPEEKLAWIIGCGRTGSTWLAEMLGDLPQLRRWHEPYFGRFMRHVEERPEELERRASFFYRRHQHVVLEGLRQLFFNMVRERYPQFGKHALVVKEVNTPEVYPWLRSLFPQSHLLLLIRDPFDVLDSYLDLQKPGSWNQTFGENDTPLTERRIRGTAEHIRDTLLLAKRTYEAFPLEQRLMLSYESLLSDPVGGLLQCGRLLGISLDPKDVTSVVDKHQFAKHQGTGEGQFRRRGQAGGWKSSAMFTGEVRDIAEEVLGTLRQVLGYGHSDS